MYTVETVDGVHHICENGHPIGEIWNCDDANDFAAFLDTRRALRSKGGKKTAETYGREFYQEIGRKGGQKLAKARGSEYYSVIGSLPKGKGDAK